MNLYPIHLNLEERRCLIVGGGKVAERKAEGLKEAGASVFIVSPTLTPALAALAERTEIEWHKGRYGTRHLDGVFLVIACTDNRGVNMTVTREALEHNLLTLCADAPEAGSFVSPSAVRRGDLLLTVSTGGSSPTLAAVVREEIEADFGPEWAELTEIIGTLREIVKTNPTEAERKAAVRRALDDPEAQTLLRDGRRLEAETRIRECLSLSSA